MRHHHSTNDEADLARWADDGGPEPDPHTRRHHADAEWLRVAAALAARLHPLAGRDDLLVTCQHRTRSGAPAAFFPQLAELEIATSLFKPHRPATLHPDRHGDEDRYPVAWGAFTHEAAHAAHSHWTLPAHLHGTALAEASEWLEESRAEHHHLQRRPADRRWLRAAIRHLILNNLGTRPPTDRWTTAQAAALILARRDTGILEPAETQALHDLAEHILGRDLLATLQTIWQAAHQTGDTDAMAMEAHARAWCQALAQDPDQPPPTPDNQSRSDALPTAIAGITSQVAAHDQADHHVHQQAADTAQARATARSQEAAARQRNQATARAVFNPNSQPYRPGTGHRPKNPVTGHRPPTPTERRAASQLARALRQAAHRERTETRTTSAAPPGRLNMRGALARDAQQAAGAIPTAQPWTSIQRRHTPNPPLRLGIAVDVSGSMTAATTPMASAAWILAHATRLTDPASRTATIAYDTALTAITHPGRAPHHVTQFRATGSGHRLAEAIDALTHALDLDRPGTARLLVIATDGLYTDDETEAAARRLARLAAAGCPALHLAFTPGFAPNPLPNAAFAHITDPTTTINVITQAATTVLARIR